ncbi:MBL fold metallo-hydrolase [Alicyclobacillus cycloheptanicus]|uniref:Glyoxylase-like metal-dependent hydrolase (Beta-lactamase superfamily II) n=1 Tax=Alicyclobacillus cycloheptanicus TaxID=1457 RepID=A0ABT9XGP0_9BACL|nr:MBL fold metallo-hydrolase [Alicyclobacillus cycloheptanicus]MDQ0189479.1 glyoxylase-like metal-dependent hydrolase (beta-lactamase superfamily II) [Alicyclobacillus cycloheptanicus]WDM01546.1 MBL fold metallo-hydrolase [Alicyclobacillus cycloheptanicus]
MEITKNVHLLTSTKGSFVYLVLGEEPVLIDTGMPGRAGRIVKDLGDIGIDPKDIRHILLTHHDVDHIGNARALKEWSGATLWAPLQDLSYIHREQPRHGIKRVIAAVIKAQTPSVDAIYQPGQTIAGIEMIETPGHTPGHVSFRFRDTLFAGDLVVSKKGRLAPSPRFLSWNTQEVSRSIQKLKSVQFDWVCPAHGAPVKRTGLFDF